MHRLLWFGIFALSFLFVGCGEGGNAPARGFLFGNPSIQTGQASIDKAQGPPALLVINWPTAFTDTNYTVVCTPKLVSGGTNSLSTVISSKATTSVQVLIQFDDSGTVQVNCLAVADSISTDVRHARASFTMPANSVPTVQKVTWSSGFTDLNYTAVCSVVAAPNGTELTSHLRATTVNDTTVWVNFSTPSAQPFEVDCFGVPDTTTSTVRHGRAQVIKSAVAPTSVNISWDTAFVDTNYFPVCDTLFVNGTELSITTNAAGSTITNQTAVVHWATTNGTGTVGCIALHP
jgi:hypothetical protein